MVGLKGGIIVHKRHFRFDTVLLLAVVVLLAVMTTTVVAQKNSVGGTTGDRKVHVCAHDSVFNQRLFHTGMDPVVPITSVTRPTPTLDDGKSRRFDTMALTGGNIIASMRIALRAEDLYNGRYCTSVGQFAPSFASPGETSNCTDSDDIFTSTKRDLLLNVVLPRALSIVSSALSVERLNASQIITVTNVTCSSMYTVKGADANPGVSNADYVLYLSAGKTTGQTLAFAGYCGLSGRSRPVVGRANFGPKHLVWNFTNNNSYQNIQIVSTAVHEIFHALGFSQPFIQGHFKNSSMTTVWNGTNRGGAPTFQLTTPKAIGVTREFFNCSTVGEPSGESTGLHGPALENEGTSAYSHWNRRDFYQEVMSPVVGDSLLTNFTLAFFEDTGFYYPNYNVSQAMTWGAKQGCGFLSEKCNVPAGGLGRFFCNDTSPSTEQCTFNFRAIGACNVGSFSSALPSYWQYYPGSNNLGGMDMFLDYCPIVRGYSNRQCDNTDLLPTSTDLIMGNAYGLGGRCVNVDGLIQKQYSGQTGNYRCLKMRCVKHLFPAEDPSVYLEISVGVNESDPASWVSCPYDGSSGSVSPPAGFKGSIQCPPANELCTDATADPLQSRRAAVGLVPLPLRVVGRQTLSHSVSASAQTHSLSTTQTPDRGATSAPPSPIPGSNTTTSTAVPATGNTTTTSVPQGSSTTPAPTAAPPTNATNATGTSTPANQNTSTPSPSTQSPTTSSTAAPFTMTEAPATTRRLEPSTAVPPVLRPSLAPYAPENINNSISGFDATFKPYSVDSSAPRTSAEFAAQLAAAMGTTTSQVQVTKFDAATGAVSFQFVGSLSGYLSSLAVQDGPMRLGLASLDPLSDPSGTNRPATSNAVPVAEESESGKTFGWNMTTYLGIGIPCGLIALFFIAFVVRRIQSKKIDSQSVDVGVPSGSPSPTREGHTTQRPAHPPGRGEYGEPSMMDGGHHQPLLHRPDMEMHPVVGVPAVPVPLHPQHQSPQVQHHQPQAQQIQSPTVRVQPQQHHYVQVQQPTPTVRVLDLDSL